MRASSYVPSTQADLARFVRWYQDKFMWSGLLPALDEAIDAETRDEAWAAGLERAILVAAGDIPELQVQSVDCRTSLCKVSFSTSTSITANSLITAIGDRYSSSELCYLTAFVRGPTQRIDERELFTAYFFRDLSDIGYAEALQRHLGPYVPDASALDAM